MLAVISEARLYKDYENYEINSVLRSLVISLFKGKRFDAEIFSPGTVQLTLLKYLQLVKGLMLP